MAGQNRYLIDLCQRAKKQGPMVMMPVLTLVLLLLVSQSAARLSWRLLDFAMPIQVEESALCRVESQPMPASTAPDYTVLADLHIFGRAGRVQVAALTDASALPTTTLKLALLGVIFSTSPKQSVAIISPKGDSSGADLYGVGDDLPGAAVLREIHPDRVVLRRGGRYETLAIEETVSSSISAPAPQIKPVKRGPRKKDRRRQIRPHGDGTNWSIDRHYLNQRLANLDSLASEIGVDVYQEDGSPQGYRLQAQAAEGSNLLKELGLQPGDVVAEVNGMPLRSASDAMQAYAKTKNADKVRIQIVRDGKRQTREYSIGQL